MVGLQALPASDHRLIRGDGFHRGAMARAGIARFAGITSIGEVSSAIRTAGDILFSFRLIKIAIHLIELFEVKHTQQRVCGGSVLAWAKWRQHAAITAAGPF